jgi:hypothetical protein
LKLVLNHQEQNCQPIGHSAQKQNDGGITVRYLLSALFVTILALGLVGCKEETPAPKAEGDKPSQQAPAPAAAPAEAPGKTGKVTETMDAAGYTYVQVETANETFWAAAPQFSVQVGDDVVVPEGMPMPNYHSKTLDRTFDMVYFVPSILVGGAEAVAQGGMPEGHPPMTGNNAPAEPATDIDMSDLTKAEGGQTVADIFAQKNELTGKPVTVRGKVVKFSPEIMGKNWIHIQDGTGEPGMNDLTITTSATAQMGDTVTISGTLVTDKDFGYGYKYDLIIEDAEVTVE